MTTTTVQEELAALRRITAQLDQLDEASRVRAMRWLTARYDPPGDVVGLRAEYLTAVDSQGDSHGSPVRR
jgi:hypothetical protein